MKILVACGNGMGSSVIMKLKVENVVADMGLDATVENTSIGDAKSIAGNYDLLLYPTAFEYDLAGTDCPHRGGLVNMVDEEEIRRVIEEALAE